MLPQIHCLLVRQDARVWALMHGSLLDGMGLVLTKADQLREKDLKRHFKGESEAEASDKLKPNLPENLKTWDVTEKLSDYQLKIALNHLNGLAPPGKATAKAP